MMNADLRHTLKMAAYYAIVSRLPNSRYGSIFNTIRLAYMTRVLRIMRCHPNNHFQEHVYIASGQNISIGEECQINEHTFIQGAEIGNRVMIAPHVSIYNSTHNTDRTDIPMIHQGKRTGLNPIIEDDVWIGTNVVILPSVRIRTGCVIGANAVVTHNTEPYCVYGGVPARLIHRRRTVNGGPDVNT